MHIPPRILVADDHEANRDILQERLRANGYDVVVAVDGEDTLRAVREHDPDLILLDIMMPKMDGIEVCRYMRSDDSQPYTPIILVTAKGEQKDIIAGLDAGADEYLTKPIDGAALVARVRSILRQKALRDQVEAQAAELARWNQSLEQRVADQLRELERVGRLKRFLAPQVAEIVVRDGEAKLFENHRRDVTVVFCDLRRFTAFSESSEPEEVWAVLAEYHATLGDIIHRYEGTLERFISDGLVVVFNDPLPCPDPNERAVRMAVDMRERLIELCENWDRRGHDLGFGIGIAHGYATIGWIGFEGRSDYTVIGSVANRASRLCGIAQHKQIVIDTKVSVAIEDLAELEPLGDFALKGFHRRVPAFNVLGIRKRIGAQRELIGPA